MDEIQTTRDAIASRSGLGNRSNGEGGTFAEPNWDLMITI
jgi:hypothetical protein